MAVGAVLCFELDAFLPEFTPALLTEVMSDELVGKLAVAAAWGKERLVGHAVVVQVIEAVAAVVVSTWDFEYVVGVGALSAGNTGDELWRVWHVDEAVFPFLQLPAEGL